MRKIPKIKSIFIRSGIRYDYLIADKDERFFSSEEIKILKYAQEEVFWLLNRNYPISNIIDFVGGRHQFSSRQRMALRRASCSNMDLEIRRGKEVSVYDL